LRERARVRGLFNLKNTLTPSLFLRARA